MQISKINETNNMVTQNFIPYSVRMSMTKAYGQVILLSSLNFAQDIMSVNIFVAIVCIVNQSDDQQTLVSINSGADTRDYYNQSTINDTELTMQHNKWTSYMIGTIFSAFDWGMMIIPVTGLLSDKFNNKHMLSLSIGIGTAATLVIPFVAMQGSYGFPLVICCRVVLGVVSAVVTTCTNKIITNWFDKEKRRVPYSIITGGNQLGSLLILAISGYLCSINSFWQPGWTLIFYTTAFCSLTVLFIWICLGKTHPARSFKIKKTTWVSYEQRNRQPSNEASDNNRLNQGSESHSENIKVSIPWKSMLTCRPLWVSITAVTSSEFCLLIILIYLPTYLTRVMHISEEYIGLYTALPLVCYWISKLAFSFAFESINDHQWISERISKTGLMKIVNSIGCLGAIICSLSMMVLTNDNWIIAIIIINMYHLFSSLHIPGCYSTLLTLAPDFAGTITGLAYFAIALSGVLGPLVIAALTPSQHLQSEWRWVFLFLTTVQVIPLIVFNIWGTSDEVISPVLDTRIDDIKVKDIAMDDNLSDNSIHG